MPNVGNVEIGLGLDDSKLQAALARVEKSISDSINKTSTESKSGIEKIASSMTDLGIKMSAAITVPITAAFKKAIDEASKYRDAMAKVFTISDSSQVSDSSLAQQILDLSTASGRASTELADATYQALSASVETSKVVGFVDESVKLAKAGFLDTAGAVDVLTTIINAYGYSADDAAMISGRLVQTQNAGKTTVNELASSMGNVIPTAAAYNVSLDNLSSAYVIMTKQGINTANATTAINGMLTELASEGSNVSNILKEQTGKSFGQLMKDGMTLGDVLKILNDYVDGDSEAFANLWGNIRASKGALAIANAGTDAFNQSMVDMANSTTLVDDALQKLATPSAKARKAMNALNNTFIVMGEEILGALAPALEFLSQTMQGVYKWFSSLDQGTKQLIIGLAAAAAAVGPLLITAGKLLKVANQFSAFQRATEAMSLFGKAMKGSEAAASALTFAMPKMGGKLASLASKVGGAVTSFGGLKAALIAAGVAVVAFAVTQVAQAIKKQQELANIGKELRESLSKTKDSVVDAGRAFEGNLGQGLRNATQAVDDMLKKQKELAEFIIESNTEVANNSAQMDRWREGIERLNGTGEQSQRSFGELTGIVDELNEKMGTNYTVAMDANDGYVIMADGARVATDEIYKLIDAQEIEMRYNATREQYTKVFNENREANEKLAEAEKTRADALKELAKAEDDYAAAEARGEEDMSQYTSRVEQMKTAVNLADEKVREATQGMEAQTETERILKQQTEFLAAAKNAEAGSMERVLATNDAFLAGMRAGGGDIYQFIEDLDTLGISTEQLATLTDEQTMAMAASYDGSLTSIVESLYGFADESGMVGGIAVENMANNMSNKTIMALEAAAKLTGLTEAEIRKIAADAGYTGDEAMYNLATAIANGEVQVDAETRTIVQSVAEEADKMKSETEASGVDAMAGLARGIRNGTSKAVNAAAAAINAVLAETDKVAGHASPWKTMIAIGEDAPKGLAVGIDKTVPQAVSAARDMVSDVLGATKLENMAASFNLNGARGVFNTARVMGAAPVGYTSSSSTVNDSKTFVIHRLEVKAEDVASVDAFVAVLERAASQYPRR